MATREREGWFRRKRLTIALFSAAHTKPRNSRVTTVAPKHSWNGWKYLRSKEKSRSWKREIWFVCVFSWYQAECSRMYSKRPANTLPRTHCPQRYFLTSFKAANSHELSTRYMHLTAFTRPHLHEKRSVSYETLAILHKLYVRFCIHVWGDILLLSPMFSWKLAALI